MLPSVVGGAGPPATPAHETVATKIQLKRGGTVLLSLCELTPWERWRHYGVRPYKLVLHLVLLLCTTARILHESRRWVPYRLSNQENVCHFFFPTKCAGANRCGATPSLLYGVDSYTDCYLFSVQETTEALGSLIYRYYHIGEIALANYGLVMEKVHTTTANNGTGNATTTDYVPQPPLLTATLRQARRVRRLEEEHTETLTFALSEEDWGPLDTRHHTAEEVRSFFHHLVRMEVHFHLEDEVAEDALNTCYLWANRLIYDARNQARGFAEIAVSQQSYIKGFCEGHRGHGLTRGDMRRAKTHHQQRRVLAQGGEGGKKKGSMQRGMWAVDPWAFRMNVLALLLSAALTLIWLRELNGALFLLRRARALLEARAARLRHEQQQQQQQQQQYHHHHHHHHHHNANPLRWRDIALGTKFRFFNFWQVLLLLGSAVTLYEAFDAVRNCQGPPMVSDGQAALRGLGAALLWIYTCRYLHHSDQLYAIILVIDNSVPRVARMLVQVVPIFIGFTLLGVMIFGAYFPRFGSFTWAFTTLFCLWNGDAIMETADQLGAIGHSRVFAMAYIVVFIFVFVYVVLNILLVVVQQTLLYVQLHHRGKRTLHRLLLRNAAEEAAEAQRSSGGGTSFHLHAHSVEQEEGDESTSSSSSSYSSSDDGLDDSGVGGNGEEEEAEGWDLRTGEVEAQRAFFQLLELTDVRDEPGVFFNDDATRAAQVIAEGHNGSSGRASRSNSGSNSLLLPVPPHLQLRQQQQQQRSLMQPPPMMGPGQPRQRRRSTLSTEITD